MDSRRSSAADDDLDCTVLCVSTASSTYHVALIRVGGRPRCGVLRSVRRADGESFEVEDETPRIEGQSLFEVPPSEWIGLHLEVADVVTSPVRTVVVEEDPAVRASFLDLPPTTSPSASLASDVFAVTARSEVASFAVTAPSAVAPPVLEVAAPDSDANLPAATVEVAPPYPEALVLLIESAARRLRAVYDAPTLAEDLREHDAELQGRFEIALAECHLRLSGLGARWQASRRRS